MLMVARLPRLRRIWRGPLSPPRGASSTTIRPQSLALIAARPPPPPAPLSGPAGGAEALAGGPGGGLAAAAFVAQLSAEAGRQLGQRDMLPHMERQRADEARGIAGPANARAAALMDEAAHHDEGVFERAKVFVQDEARALSTHVQNQVHRFNEAVLRGIEDRERAVAREVENFAAAERFFGHGCCTSPCQRI
jgi:hypothetical protein